MLHITNGDCAAELIRACGIGGEVLPWRDVLHEGPVPAGLELQELSRLRARYIAEQGWGELAQLQERFRERDRTLADLGRHEEVVLWFESDLYDQLQILQILDWIGGQETARQTRISLIYIDQLESEQAAALFPERQPVSGAQTDLATLAWKAFRSPDPTAVDDLLSSDCSPLPYLGGALRRHLEQFPSVRNGLGRTEQQILAHTALGESSAADLFRNDQLRESHPFLGDSTFFSYLKRLAGASRPLIVIERTVALTAAGHDVLAGRSDAVDLNGVDRWWGGVHQTGKRPLWRWDEGNAGLTWVE